MELAPCIKRNVGDGYRNTCVRVWTLDAISNDTLATREWFFAKGEPSIDANYRSGWYSCNRIFLRLSYGSSGPSTSSIVWL